MENNKSTIIVCPKCGLKIRIPANKHIKFTCPDCGEQYVYQKGGLTAKPLQQREQCEKGQESQDSIWWRIFLWICAIFITFPFYAFTRRFIPDLDWIGHLDEFIVFAIIYVFVRYTVGIAKWFLLGVVTFLLIFLTIGTIKDGGYGFDSVLLDYATFVYNAKYEDSAKRREITMSKIPHKFTKGYSGAKKVKNNMTIEQKIRNAADYNEPIVKDFANQLCTNPRQATFAEQASSKEMRVLLHSFAIWEEINRNWHYVDEDDYYAKASETIQNKANNKYTGDCDDHAIVMCACIKAIGGKSKVIISRKIEKKSTGVDTTYHAFPIVFVGDEQARQTAFFNISNMYYDSTQGGVEPQFLKDRNGIYWLNLDFGKKYPGDCDSFHQNRKELQVDILGEIEI